MFVPLVFFSLVWIFALEYLYLKIIHQSWAWAIGIETAMLMAWRHADKLLKTADL